MLISLVSFSVIAFEVERPQDQLVELWLLAGSGLLSLSNVAGFERGG